MEITVAGQTWMFLWSLALGAALGVCYDVFRILRVALRHSAGAVLAEDLVFALLCAAATLIYLLCADCGEIRAFVLIGEAVGFALYYCTVGALVIGAAKGIIAAIRWVAGFLWRIFGRPVVRLSRSISGFLSRKAKNTANCLKNKVKNSGTHLKRHSGLLYNLKKRLHWGRLKKIEEGQDERGI